ncbi:hypothetical protein BDU57DRAFT_24600 [Ampelomyces quisqualis]|uniref:Uncharacterized protein n=1 Tax=Ampelomyces quisqualis TaxID=50730 RepID=A0A6A5R0W4_AMPQU|nr:hypothetical protein BDU57DRAFT_24600 [Ampelomyces quisqualis]
MSGDLANAQTKVHRTSGDEESFSASRLTTEHFRLARYETEPSWESVAKCATNSSKQWYSKYFRAKEMAKNKELQTQRDMEATLNGKEGAIEELRAKQLENDKAHVSVVKNLEKKIRQMHRTARDQENLIQELQADIARRDDL